MQVLVVMVWGCGSDGGGFEAADLMAEPQRLLQGCL